MKTKAQVVQRLIEERHIDAEEAVILLMSDKEVQYIPYPYNPQPFIPINPMWPTSPYYPLWQPTISFDTNQNVNATLMN